MAIHHWHTRALPQGGVGPCDKVIHFAEPQFPALAAVSATSTNTAPELSRAKGLAAGGPCFLSTKRTALSRYLPY